MRRSTRRRSGVTAVLAMGFYGPMGGLLASWAMDDSPEADEIALGTALSHWHPTPGTRRTGDFCFPSRTFRRFHAMRRVTRILSLAIPGLTLLAACAARQEVRYGPESALGNGTVRTYLITDESGRAAELGVAISDVAMATVPDLSQNRPMESFLTIDLELPEGVPAPYKLVGFFWRPAGHPPVGIYDVPHFEFHFYTIDAATRNAIVPGEGDVPSETGEFVEGRFAERASRAPAPGYLPATYAYTPGSAVPMMGGHWIDRQSHEFHGQLFDRTLVYGTWDGEVIFIQPMITRAFIESKPQGTFEIPLTQKARAPGWHPSAYTVKYDADAKEYRIGLAGFAEPG